MNCQTKVMLYDPVTGYPNPSPNTADRYRVYHGAIAWLFNPWTGLYRGPRDIGSDVLGYLIADGMPEGAG